MHLKIGTEYFRDPHIGRQIENVISLKKNRKETEVHYCKRIIMVRNIQFWIDKSTFIHYPISMSKNLKDSFSLPFILFSSGVGWSSCGSQASLKQFLYWPTFWSSNSEFWWALITWPSKTSLLHFFHKAYNLIPITDVFISHIIIDRLRYCDTLSPLPWGGIHCLR